MSALGAACLAGAELHLWASSVPPEEAPPSEFRLPQPPESFQFIGISPTDEPAAITRKLSVDAQPAALDPFEQRGLRYLKMRRQVSQEPLVFFQSNSIGSSLSRRPFPPESLKQLAHRRLAEFFCPSSGTEALLIQTLGNFPAVNPC